MKQDPSPIRPPRFSLARTEMRDAGVPWLGKVPAHWRVVRVGLVGSVLVGRQRTPQYEKGEHLRPYLRVANVLDGLIDYSDVLQMNFEPYEQLLFGLKPGDILLNEGQSRELVGRSAVYRGEPGAYCFQNSLIRFRVHDDLDPEFVQTQFASWLPLGAFQLFCRQSTNIAHLGADRLAQMHMAVPPLEEQRAIARFVRAQTRPIDLLLEAKRLFLDVLAEKRKAIIATAVTRGLDPNVKLRDSGVPWLGKIPAHWKFRRSKYLFRQSASPVRTGDEIVTCFRDGQVTLRRNRREEGFTNADLEVGYQGIRQGQLVLHSMDAFAGAIGVSDSDGRCSPEYIICDPLDDGVIVPEYFGPLLRTMALAGFVQASCPAVRERAPRIRFNDLGEMYLPVPPQEEQRAVVEHIACETAKLDAVRAATERTIALLKERRSALIAAAVTGQLDVGAVA